MQKGAQRTCTVQVCFDDTNLMEVNKSSFDNFVGEYKTESVKTIINFYRSCYLFKILSDQKKVELSAKSFMIKYPSNTVIVRQNDIPYNIYFIAAGGVRLVRRINLDDGLSTDALTLDSKRHMPLESHDDLLGTCSLLETMKRRRESTEGTKLFQVGLLKEGDSFADWELFHNKAVMDSVITTVPTLIIYVPYFWIVERLGPNDLARIKDTSKSKIKNEIILKSFQENAQWNDFKKSLVQNLVYEKECRLSRLGKSHKITTKKVDIDSKSKGMVKLVGPPATIGVRLAKKLTASSSSSLLPPIRRSTLKPSLY